MTTFQTIDPYTEEVVATREAADHAAIEAALEASARGAARWQALGVEGRAACFERLADRLQEERASLARLAATEMGKPVAQGAAEAAKCAALLRHYAREGAAMLAPTSRRVDAFEVETILAPIGAVFSVTPWNFPLWQVLRAAVPAMTVGNVVLNKPAPNVIGSAEAVVRLASEAGWPEGALQTISVTNEDAARIIADDRIAGVCLTGSEQAGRAVAGAAGVAGKKAVLELGGSDPFLVFADADVAAAAQAGAASRFNNAGQVCIAAKRFVIEERVRADFLDAFLAATRGYVLGDPKEEATRLGPLARGDLREGLERQVEASVEAGARVVLRGGREGERGFGYAPTVLADVPQDAPAWREETFGPIAAVVGFPDGAEEEAIRLANATRFGLSANLWTSDEERGTRLARKLQAGSVFVNGVTASHPAVAFGGMKASGFGRELGEHGLLEFANLKPIWRRLPVDG